ncbi:MAG: fluoride efflux transporter CrcB [Gammaproteobacteria bacterium]|nr:fluoride efflux transporter CrcB [Gammaproteobacteria bacterium]
MNQVLAIAAGGAVGSVLRYWSSLGVHHLFGRGFPYGTLSVNVLGSLVIGVLYVLLVERSSLGAEWRALLITGFLGGFTTFSTFSLETALLLQQAEHLKAVLNIAASVAICLAATLIGLYAGRQL